MPKKPVVRGYHVLVDVWTMWRNVPLNVPFLDKVYIGVRLV